MQGQHELSVWNLTMPPLAGPCQCRMMHLPLPAISMQYVAGMVAECACIDSK